MTTAEFLEEYGRCLLRPITGVTAEALYGAFVGYVKNDFAAFAALKPRDQLAVVLLFVAIRDADYQPTVVTREDVAHFKPDEGRMDKAEDRKYSDYSAYIEFVNLVAKRRW